MEVVDPVRKIAVRLCAYVVCFLFVYFLSAGPAAYYVQRHNTARNIAIVTTVYRPLLNVPLFQSYTRFWADLALKKP